MRTAIRLFTLLLLPLAIGPAAQAQSYYVYVAAESEDEVALVRFDGETAEVIKTIEVGTWPTEIEGPHGMTVSPDGEHWYLSLAHGQPYGKVIKYKAGTDEKVGEAELGLFPASMQISEMTGLLYVVNFNLHGKMEPSSVSVVDPETMTEQRTLPPGTTLGTDFSEIRFDELARSMGAHGERVRRARELRPALERCLASGLPSVVHVDVDPVAHLWAPGLDVFKKMHLEPGE